MLGWLFVQLAATGLLGPAPVHAAGLGAHSAPVSFITICTPEGIKEVAFPGSAPETPGPKPSALGGCEWCRSLDGPADVARPAGCLDRVLSTAGEVLAHAETPSFGGRHDRDPYRVRAPPT